MLRSALWLARKTPQIIFQHRCLHRFSSGPQNPKDGDVPPENMSQEDVQIYGYQSEYQINDDATRRKIKVRRETEGIKRLNCVYLFDGSDCPAFRIWIHNKNKAKQVNVSYTGKALIGGPWKLLKIDGTTMTHEDLAGSYYLIYFGFCNCPDICPNSLYKLSKALQRIRNLPEGKVLKLQTLFVTVDPDRDDAERIKKFLSHFDPSIIALTGSANDDPDLKETMRTFKIYASKIQYELDDEQQKTQPAQSGEDPYTIDHTIITYLMDDENNYVTHLGSNLGEYDLSKTIIEKIYENERRKMSKYK